MMLADIDSLAPEEVRRLVTGRHLQDTGWLVGETVAGVFEHPSLRTRSALAKASFALGALPVFFVGDEVGIDRRESAEDVARLLAEHHRAIAARLRSHEVFVRMAKVADALDVPIINLLTDRAHPTQAIADCITICEELSATTPEDCGTIRVVYLGDANNVARSLAKAALAMGMQVVISSPPGHSFGPPDLEELAAWGERCQARHVVEVVTEPREAVEGADVLYTDAWVSMGEEGKDVDAFVPYRLDEELVKRAPEARIMHCLPAHRGQEITDAVIDSAQSLVWRQARNRVVAMRRILELVGEG
jgi:ornithine carbamoyltransferase